MRKIDLGPKITSDSAQALWYQLEAEFEALGSKPMLELDAGKVVHLGAAALQVLLVARARAQRDGGSLTIANASDQFCKALGQMGALSMFEEVAA